MATPSVELPWHHHPHRPMCSSAKQPLNCFGNQPSGHTLSLKPKPRMGGLCSSTFSDTMTGGKRLQTNTHHQQQERGVQKSSLLFRVGVFNPLWSKSLIQMHLNRIFFYQASAAYWNATHAWNVHVPLSQDSPCLTKLSFSCQEQPSATEQERELPKASSAHPETTSEVENVPKSTSELSTLNGLKTDTPQDVQQEMSFPTKAQIPPPCVSTDHCQQDLEDQTIKVTDFEKDPETSSCCTSVIIQPQEQQGSVTNNLPSAEVDDDAWQPMIDQKNDNCDSVKIKVTLDSGSESLPPYEYAIHTLQQCDLLFGESEEEDEESSDEEESECECEFFQSDSESENDQNKDREEEDDFIEFSDESFHTTNTADSETSNPGVCHLMLPSQQPPVPPLRCSDYLSLLSAESGYFEGSSDSFQSCEDDDEDTKACETQTSGECEDIWKVFEDQALSPVLSNCSSNKTSCPSTLAHKTSSPPRSSKRFSSHSAASSEQCINDKEAVMCGEHEPESSSILSSKSPASKVKCVRFKPDCELVKVHYMVTWNYAYRAARKGIWEEYARDRMHFMHRVSKLAPILEPCLAKKIAIFSSVDSNADCVR